MISHSNRNGICGFRRYLFHSCLRTYYLGWRRFLYFDWGVGASGALAGRRFKFWLDAERGLGVWRLRSPLARTWLMTSTGALKKW